MHPLPIQDTTAGIDRNFGQKHARKHWNETQCSPMFLCKELEYHDTTPSILGDFYSVLRIILFITFNKFLNNCLSYSNVFLHVFDENCDQCSQYTYNQ